MEELRVEELRVEELRVEELRVEELRGRDLILGRTLNNCNIMQNNNLCMLCTRHPHSQYLLKL